MDTNLKWDSIRNLCGGMTISELSRLTGIARNTVYKLERGDPVRETKIIQLLNAMASEAKFQPVHSFVQERIQHYVNSTPTYRNPSQIIEALRSIEIDLHVLVQEFEDLASSNPRPLSFAEYEKKQLLVLIKELDKLASRIVRT